MCPLYLRFVSYASCFHLHLNRSQALADNRIEAPITLEVFSRLAKGDSLPRLQRKPRYIPQFMVFYFIFESHVELCRPPEDNPAMPSRTPNKALLKQAWDVSRVADSYDAWTAWFTELTAQLVKESPSVSLRSCMNLFDVYPHISSRLFSPALASCWSELPEPFQVLILIYYFRRDSKWHFRTILFSQLRK